MNVSVLLFFLHNVLASLFLGGKFVSRKDQVIKNFGIALLLDAVAFAIWSIAVVLRPENLAQYATGGALFFIASLVFFLLAGTQNMSASVRKGVLAFGVIAGALVFYLRTFVYPSAPAFSSEGLFFFNLQPMAQMLYIFGLVLTAIPAIDLLASKFKSSYSTLVRYGFIAEVIGGILLITSTDALALNITGWIIGTAHLALWTTLLFSRKAWAGVK